MEGSTISEAAQKHRTARQGPPRDEDTVAYFDEHLIDYAPARFRPAIDAIERLRTPGGTLVDLGCGTGNTLQFVREATGLESLVGIDVSARCVQKTRERVGCETIQASVLDRDYAARLEGRFDIAIAAALLHHLIGRTRAGSERLARLARDNALRMLKPGGHLVVIEPTFSPASANTVLFYVKKVVTRVASGRVELLGHEDNNIGPPVVSYYTEPQLMDLLTFDGAVELIEYDSEPQPLGRGGNLLFDKRETTVVLRKERRGAAAVTPADS